MARSGQVPVPTGATPTALNPSGADRDSTLGNSLAIYNSGTVDLILGGSDVTTANGFRACKVGTVVTIDVGEGETVYALSASATVGGLADVLRTR